MSLASLARRLGTGVVTACLFAATAADAAIYIKFDGIDGEVVEAKHLNWIEASSVTWGLGLSSAARPALVFDDVAWSQALDAAFPDLFLAAARRDEFATVRIAYTKPVRGKVATYFEMTFSQATIDTLHLYSSPDRSVVEGTFGYEQIAMTYTPFSTDGKAGKPRTASFDTRQGGAAAAAALLSVYQLGITDPPAPAVPEPESWALMALGLGALAVAARRTRRARH